jgi:hypothetical protein
MRKSALSAALLALVAAPASAQYPYEAGMYEDDPIEAYAYALPDRQRQIEATTHALDRVLGAMLDIDIGPVIDAVDPYRRGPAYGYGPRTLRDMAGRDDPYFEDRIRHSLYGTSIGMSRMMDAFAVAAPVMRESIRRMERDIAEAMRNVPARDIPPPRD